MSPRGYYKRQDILEAVVPTSQANVHLGCGDILLDRWINVDFYSKYSGVQKWQLNELKVPDESCDVLYSCHSLEHVSLPQAKSCIFEWWRVLKEGGILYLSIPDIEKICELFPSNPKWYIQCIYGMQTDEGQIHKFGYTESMIKEFLTNFRFKIIFFDKFDYGPTPSFWIEARK